MIHSPPADSRPFLGLDARSCLRALLIGALPMLALLALMCGSLANAVQLIVVSAVCTLGIGAFFWVGMAMLCGIVLQFLVPPLRPRPPAGSAAAEPRRSDAPTPGGQPLVAALLVNYTRARLVEGASEEGVRRDLLRSGWSELQATAALEEARILLNAGGAAGTERFGDGG